MKVFFLGGRDLEMQIIRGLLEEHNQKFSDKELKWDTAKASAYAEEITKAEAEGQTPVLVELVLDIELPPSTIVIDHHGDRANEEASLLQVIRLLDLTPTRPQVLVAANDAGYIPAMLRLGASRGEVDLIRQMDRWAQGITLFMETDAKEAIARAEVRRGVTIVSIPHTKCAAVTDRLFMDWPDGKENLIIVGKIDEETVEIDYFGRGDICRAMKETFSGWGGGQGYGDAGKNGFAGCKTTNPVAVITFITERQ